MAEALFNDDPDKEQVWKVTIETQFQGWVRFIDNQVDDWGMAQDIAADCCKKVLEKSPPFSTADDLAGYIFITIKNAVKNFKAANKVQKKRLKNIPIPDRYNEHIPGVLGAEDIYRAYVDQINQALLELPPQQQKILRLIYYEGLSYTEIAELMNLSRSTVYNQHTNALNKLRVRFGKDFLTDPPINGNT